MRGREHLDLQPKEKLRGRGDGRATRVPRPHLRSLTGKRPRRHRGRRHIGAHRCPRLTRRPPAAPARMRWSGLRTKVGIKKKKDCIQTRISEQAVTQTALFRGGERVRATRHYSCNLSKTVGERKHCLWFKAQANKMGDGALCLLSAVRLECKAVGVKGVWKEPSRCRMNTDVYLKNASIAFFQMN